MNIIRTRKDLKEWLKYEKKLYPLNLFAILTRNQRYYNWKYIKLLRHCEYYRNSKYKFLLLLFPIYRLRRNLLGAKIGVQITENCFQKGLLICHHGSIVVNRFARIGENAILHGCNCIGSIDNDDCPIIGNNVEFGVGSIVLGKVKLADNIKIGANSTVLKDCLESNVTLVGSPAKIIKK
ncbi:MAG: serine acetyltransferase [Bacilli bacterium]|nr:serine acetyltransferase [Bacilli bacterium]